MRALRCVSFATCLFGALLLDPFAALAQSTTPVDPATGTTLRISPGLTLDEVRQRSSPGLTITPDPATDDHTLVYDVATPVTMVYREDHCALTLHVNRSAPHTLLLLEPRDSAKLMSFGLDKGYPNLSSPQAIQKVLSLRKLLLRSGWTFDPRATVVPAAGLPKLFRSGVTNGLGQFLCGSRALFLDATPETDAVSPKPRTYALSLTITTP